MSSESIIRTTLRAEKKQEQFSLAYAHAVSAAAGCHILRSESVDEDSVDITIKAEMPAKCKVMNPKIEVQLKTTVADIESNGTLHYPLKLKNYNDLRRSNIGDPQILVLLLMPRSDDHWVWQTDRRTFLFRCAYWCSLRGMPETTNKKTVTVHIPKTQIFSPATLRRMMSVLSEGRKF